MQSEVKSKVVLQEETLKGIPQDGKIDLKYIKSILEEIMQTNREQKGVQIFKNEIVDLKNELGDLKNVIGDLKNVIGDLKNVIGELIKKNVNLEKTVGDL